MPPGLDIEREKPLKGTMPPYARHVLVRTGRHDWWRRIEDEEGGNFARSLKALVGPGGKLHNVCILFEALFKGFLTLGYVLFLGQGRSGELIQARIF